MDLTKYKRVLNKPRFNWGTNNNNSGYSFNYENSDDYVKRNLGYNNSLGGQFGTFKNSIGGNNQSGSTGYTGNYTQSTLTGKAAIPGAVTNTLNFGMQTYSMFNQPVASTNQLMTEAGTSQGSINGVQYEQQNAIDSVKAEEDLKAENSSNTMKSVGGGAAAGAAIGMCFGPIGGAIGAVAGGILGGVFGGAAAKKRAAMLRQKIYNGQQKTLRTNIYNRTGAQSTAMQQDYANKYGDTHDDILYANNGKDLPKYNTGKDGHMKNTGKVWTPDGYMKGEHNSQVGFGEVLFNKNQGKAVVVDKGKYGADDQKSSIREDDDNIILGNDVDWTTGRTFAEQGRPHAAAVQDLLGEAKKIGKYGDRSSLTNRTQTLWNKLTNEDYQNNIQALSEISDKQAKQHDAQEQMEMTPYYNNGKSRYLPHYLSGKLGSAVDWRMGTSSALGALEALARKHLVDSQDIETSNTYRANPYEAKALQGMASLRSNYRPALNELRNSTREAKYSLDQLGGLTAGQKMLARTQMLNNYLNSAANLYAQYDEANNKYKKDYYSTLLSAGESNRQALTNAVKYDNDVYAKARAAKLAMSQQASKDFLENIYRWDKKKTDWDMFKDNVALWQADQDIKRKNAEAGLYGNTTTSYPAYSPSYIKMMTSGNMNGWRQYLPSLTNNSVINMYGDGTGYNYINDAKPAYWVWNSIPQNVTSNYKSIYNS